MKNSVRRLTVLLATAGAGLAMSVGPAAADTNGVSDTTQQAWKNWDQGACLVGGGAGKMVSGAWIGVPNSILDLGNGGAGLSPATKQAWKNWDDGARMVGHGAGMMVSGAWIGVPNSILDLGDRAGSTASVPDVPLPMMVAAECQ